MTAPALTPAEDRGGARGRSLSREEFPMRELNESSSAVRAPDRATCDVSGCDAAAIWETGGGAQATSRFCAAHRAEADAQPENEGTRWERIDADPRQAVVDRSRCSFGQFRPDRCPRPAVAHTETISACEEHRAVYEGMVGQPVRWRRFDGGAVAIVVVVLAFLLAPGCGRAEGTHTAMCALYVSVLKGVAIVACVVFVACVIAAVRRAGRS